MNYYDEKIKEIEEYISQEKYELALQEIDKELAMPYLPQDSEGKLKQLKRDVTFVLSEKKNPTSLPIEEVLELLKGNEKEQFYAASYLSSFNLREIVEDIKAYLADDPFENAASLILEAIAEQGLKDEFIYRKNDLEYIFYGDSLIPIGESEGFLEAYHLLGDLLEKDYPSMLKMTRTLLANHCYLLLPLSLEKEEAHQLAYSFIEEVSQMMDDGKTFQEIKDKIQRMN